jgi:S-adenosylmethionine decarboxylase
MSSEKHKLVRPYLARHKLVDFYGCSPSLLMFSNYLENILMQAATKAGCAIVGVKSHQFNPVGATVMVLVAESHFSIHTWPEKNQALVDVFASGDMDLELAIDFIGKSIEASSRRVIDVERG